MSDHYEPRDGGGTGPYEPPALNRIRLVPDEAVLASCKNTQTLGPGGFGQKCSGPPALCSHNAS